MFFRPQDWIILLIFLTASVYCWAGVSQTTRFTLSVTIPEHTVAPATTPIPNLDAQDPQTKVRMNLQTETRGQTPVLIASYLVD